MLILFQRIPNVAYAKNSGRGECPGFAPMGYINDSRTKTVVVDKKNAPIIRKAFELYAQNNSTALRTLQIFWQKKELFREAGKS